MREVIFGTSVLNNILGDVEKNKGDDWKVAWPQALKYGYFNPPVGRWDIAVSHRAHAPPSSEKNTEPAGQLRWSENRSVTITAQLDERMQLPNNA